MRTLIFCALLLPLAAMADYSDISGSFEGDCLEVKYDGKKNIYRIRYEITQATKVQVKVVTTMHGLSIEENYDITQGLSVQNDDPNTRIVTGGTFGTEDDSFAGTVMFMNEEGNIDIVLNEYSKVKKDGADLLRVTQTAPGSRMTCELPVAKD